MAALHLAKKIETIERKIMLENYFDLIAQQTFLDISGFGAFFVRFICTTKNMRNANSQ